MAQPRNPGSDKLRITQAAGKMWHDRRAVSTLEYGMIASAFALVILVAVRGYAANMSSMFSYIATNI